MHQKSFSVCSSRYDCLAWRDGRPPGTNPYIWSGSWRCTFKWHLRGNGSSSRTLKDWTRTQRYFQCNSQTILPNPHVSRFILCFRDEEVERIIFRALEQFKRSKPSAGVPWTRIEKYIASSLFSLTGSVIIKIMSCLGTSSKKESFWLGSAWVMDIVSVFIANDVLCELYFMKEKIIWGDWALSFFWAPSVYYEWNMNAQSTSGPTLTFSLNFPVRHKLKHSGKQIYWYWRKPEALKVTKPSYFFGSSNFWEIALLFSL